jgi:hypothetical protein
LTGNEREVTDMGTGSGRHARRTAHSTAISLTISFAVAFAAIVSAFIVHLADEPAGAPPTEPSPVAVQPLPQQGRLVAVSPDSLTAQTPDGALHTYAVDAQTHGITAAGSRIGSTAETFAVNDEVDIIAVLRGGQHVAMTIAHRDVAALNGPPMDYALP